MDLILSLLVGLLVGIHVATWGMYKDAIHEGFTWRTYFRSVVVAPVVAVIAHRFTHFDMTRASSLFVTFGLVYAMERATVEFYKVFIRDEDQSKYFIPMQFSVFGKVVRDRRVRSLVAAGCVAAVLLVLWGLSRLQRANLGAGGLVIVLAIGSIGGWLAAFGGAWKDAPVEGFETFKFFRSPMIALFWAVVLSLFTTNYIFMAAGGLGYSVATIETYKTFFFPSKPRGKFAGKPILYPEMIQRRKRFVPLYVGVWVAVLAGLGLALMQPRQGLI